MEIERQLDEILKLIINSTTIDNEAISFEKIKLILKYENVFDLTSHLRQLQEDKFIDITNSIKDGLGNLISQQKHGVHYYSTTKGKLFEGYVEKKRQEIIRNTSTEDRLKRMEKNEAKVAYWTKMLVWSSLALACIEVVVHRKEIVSLFFSPICHCH